MALLRRSWPGETESSSQLLHQRAEDSNIRTRNWPSTQWSGQRTTNTIREVKNPRLIETGYQSPQLTLWTLGPDEWLLFLKLPDYAARTKPQKKPDVIQLLLPDLIEPGQQAI